MGMIYTESCEIDRLRQNFRPGPSFVEEIRSGSIAAEAINEIRFIRFPVKPTNNPVFWSEDGYEAYESENVTSEDVIREFVKLIRTHTIDGIPHRSHPTTRHKGTLRISLRDGGFYYVGYVILHEFRTDTHFVSLKSNARFSVNQAWAKDYENTPLGEFMHKYDPFWAELPE